MFFLKKTLIIFSLIIFCEPCLAQDHGGYLEVIGTVMNGSVPLNGATLKIFKNDQLIETIPTKNSGKLVLHLDYDYVFLFEFSKEGFATKSIMIDSHIPEKEKSIIISYEFRLDLSVSDSLISKIPPGAIAKISYSSLYDDFHYEANYNKVDTASYNNEIIKKSQDDDGKIFTLVEQMPKFTDGGEAGLMKYLHQNIRYPAKARENGISGTVYITFVIDENGNVTDVKLIRGIGGGCDEEALRVIGGMPTWIPGMQKGKNVRVQYNIPIRFGLGGSGSYSESVKDKHSPFYYKGVKQFEEKEYDKAIESFTKAIQKDSTDIDSYFNRAACYKKSGNDSSACADWQKAKELGDKESEKLLLKYCNK